MLSQLNGIESERNPKSSLEAENAENATDTVGYWFAVGALGAFIVAGVIVYRAGNSDFSTVANDLRTASHYHQARVRSPSP